MLVGVLFALLELPHAWCMLLHKFLAPGVDHWCSPPPVLDHWSQGDSSSINMMTQMMIMLMMMITIMMMLMMMMMMMVVVMIYCTK